MKKFLKSFRGFVNESVTTEGESGFVKALTFIRRTLSQDAWTSEIGDFVEGFTNVQYSSIGNIGKVINHYEGTSSVSTRKDFDGLESKEGLNFSPEEVSDNSKIAVDFNLDMSNGSSASGIAFYLMKGGNQIDSTDIFKVNDVVNSKNNIAIFRITAQFREIGKYILTNSVDDQYFLEIEVRPSSDLGVKESRRTWMR